VSSSRNQMYAVDRMPGIDALAAIRVHKHLPKMLPVLPRLVEDQLRRTGMFGFRQHLREDVQQVADEDSRNGIGTCERVNEPVRSADDSAHRSAIHGLRETQLVKQRRLRRIDLLDQ